MMKKFRLLCNRLTHSNASSDPAGSLKNWSPTVTIGITENSISRFDTNITYTMMESMVYFDAYRPVLEALQSFGANGDLPFSDILLGKNKKVNIPAYLRERAETPLGGAGGGGNRKFLTSFHALAIPPAEKKGWDFSSVFPSMGTRSLWNPVAGDPFPLLPNDPPLDASQKEAIKLALSNELSIIQGPPGRRYRGFTFLPIPSSSHVRLFPENASRLSII